MLSNSAIGTTTNYLPSYVAHGRVTLTTYKSPGRAKAAIVTHFKLETTNGLWKLRSHFSGNRYEEIGYDGTNCFYMAAGPDASGKVRELLSIGSVWRGEYPSKGFSTTRFVWLALCSGQYYKTNKESTFVPWGIITLPLAASYSHDVKNWTSNMFFPLHIKWTYDPILFRRESNELGRYADGKIRSLTTGFVGGEYDLLVTTNVNGYELPKVFRLKRFATVDEQRVRSVILQQFDGIVERYSSVDVFAPRPEFLKNGRATQISDFRLSPDRMLRQESNYRTTNRWYATNDSIVLTNYSRVQAILAARTKYADGLGKTKSIIMIGLFVIVSLGFLNWILKSCKAIDITKQKQESK